MKSETRGQDTQDTFESCFPDVVSKTEEKTSKMILEFVLGLGEDLADFIEDLLVVDLNKVRVTSVFLA